MLQLAPGLGKRAIRDAALLQIGRGHGGKHMRGVEQGVFHGLAGAGLDLFHKHLEHHPAGHAQHQKHAQQQPQSNAHGSALKRVAHVPVGLNHRWVGAGLAQLGAQQLDVGVDRAL